MLHRVVLSEMLALEVDVAKERLGSSISFVEVRGADVWCRLITPKQAVSLLFRGDQYDAEPFRVSVTREDGTPLPGAEWPTPLRWLDHPVFGGPFICVQGTYEYHAHPSHFENTWDKHRFHIRLADLLLHIQKRMSQQ